MLIEAFTVDTLSELRFTAFTEDTNSVELTVPELAVRELPEAVWKAIVLRDAFTVETLTELRFTAFTEEVVNVE